ncbi:hypothetical protein K2173_011307 [Erythroxylum novogranatense]|uniref:RRM domain-containing protein n=1 Tax=Erythroxylum novogranatense TaxID=1862640 RepID=A0AAV8S9B8_9ROSI|nr:hypothetical protein K2173_011307 [Erythroxylum novogranatense]
MGSVDRVEERTFKMNFSEEGVVMLRDRVMDKLKEFMGDYTDDTLVEYVIVLLRNGRRKDEARNELNVFLGDDSDSFVSWLWDHLASNLELYVCPPESNKDEMGKTKPKMEDLAGKNESKSMDLKPEKGNQDTLSKRRHQREWKGLLRDEIEQSPLQNYDVDSSHVEESAHRKFNDTVSSTSHPLSGKRKRTRHDERQHIKWEEVSQATVNAPRRLLQFAVRDAVGTVRSSVSAKQSSAKRLRSVVSTSAVNSSLVDRPRRIQSIARVPNALATVVKAVQEAAEDVMKVKPAGSVFDRLGHSADVSENIEQVDGFGDPYTDDEDYEELDEIQEDTYLDYPQRGDHVRNVRKTNIRAGGIGLSTDSLSYDEGYDDLNIIGHRPTNVAETDAYGMDHSLSTMQYGENENLADGMQVAQSNNQDQSGSTANSSRKIVNFSGNINIWKQPHYTESRQVADLDTRNSFLGARNLKENSEPVTVDNGNVKFATEIDKESQKTLPSVPGPYTASRPLEDADSRTIFVSNVHFAATKDSLSRHFNKFGEVLKVVIVTDAATGQPKGSAYVEFMRKEAADNALSLDGTSFMSRILKVVKRSSTSQEPASLVTWPRAIRGSPFAAARFSRVPFQRGMSGQFWPRLAVKPGARSMQWKRDAQPTTADNSTSNAVNNIFSPTARSLTYVRSELKPAGPT